MLLLQFQSSNLFLSKSRPKPQCRTYWVRQHLVPRATTLTKSRQSVARILDSARANSQTEHCQEDSIRTIPRQGKPKTCLQSINQMTSPNATLHIVSRRYPIHPTETPKDQHIPRQYDNTSLRASIHRTETLHHQQARGKPTVYVNRIIS